MEQRTLCSQPRMHMNARESKIRNTQVGSLTGFVVEYFVNCKKNHVLKLSTEHNFKELCYFIKEPLQTTGRNSRFVYEIVLIAKYKPQKLTFSLAKKFNLFLIHQFIALFTILTISHLTHIFLTLFLLRSK